MLLPGTIFYQHEPDALSAEWEFTDLTSKVPHMLYAIGTYPGAEDIISTTNASVRTGEGTLPFTVMNLNTEGDLRETWQCTIGGKGVVVVGVCSHALCHLNVPKS